MTTRIWNSFRDMSRAPKGRGVALSASDATDRFTRSSGDRSHAATTLICSAIVTLLSCSAVTGQTDPDAASSRRAGKALSNRKTAPTEALAAEHASPDADYAIDSLLSRTAAPRGADNADADISDVLARRLWQNRISAPDPDEDADTRLALQNLINRVGSIRFSGGDGEPRSSTPTTAPTAQTTRPATTPVIDTTPQPTRPLPTVTAPVTQSPPALAPATLERLESLLQDPNQVDNPLDMAELLFLSGRPAKAAIFYERALARLTSGEPSQDEDRAWILFQLGNCLRETDMAKAKASYMKLISQYPGSPWTELAKAHGRLITWYQGANPQQWMPTKETP